MDELYVRQLVKMHRAVRKRAQPVQIGRRELFASPEGGQAGDGVELVEVHEAANGFVVIAANESASQSLRLGDDFVGISSVADRIAKVDDEVMGRSGGQTGVQRLEIAVNVAKKEDTHKGRIIAVPGANGRSWVSNVRSQVSGKAGLDCPRPKTYDLAFTTGQRAQCAALTSTSGGSLSAHSATRYAQRGSNGHPEGSCATFGTLPSMVANGTLRSVERVGIACNSP